MSAAEFERFRAAVLADRALQQRLRPLTDPREFVACAAILARELGLSVDEADVNQALNAARREWLERWITA